ncbi:MAG: hypothetical protein V4723_07505 [Pseudomonadota bacterium]
MPINSSKNLVAAPFDPALRPRWLDFASYRPRQDSNQERVVVVGVDLQRHGGTARAAAYLRARGIPLPIALRVLTRPHLRRKVLT